MNGPGKAMLALGTSGLWNTSNADARGIRVSVNADGVVSAEGIVFGGSIGGPFGSHRPATRTHSFSQISHTPEVPGITFISFGTTVPPEHCVGYWGDPTCDDCNKTPFNATFDAGDGAAVGSYLDPLLDSDITMPLRNHVVPPAGEFLYDWVDDDNEEYWPGTEVELEADTNFTAQYKDIPDATFDDSDMDDIVVDIPAGFANTGAPGLNVTLPAGHDYDTPAAGTRHNFLGWQLDGAGANLAAGATYNWPADDYTDKNFEPNWETQFRVTFDSDGGEFPLVGGTPAAEEWVTSGELADDPGALSKAGSTFDHWAIEGDLGNAYDFSTPVTAPLALVAVFETLNPDYAELIFDAGVGFTMPNGERAYSTTVSGILGGTAVAPNPLPVPATGPDKHRFDGWESAPGTAFEAGDSVTGHMTLTAVWVEMPITSVAVDMLRTPGPQLRYTAGATALNVANFRLSVTYGTGAEAFVANDVVVESAWVSGFTNPAVVTDSKTVTITYTDGAHGSMPVSFNVVVVAALPAFVAADPATGKPVFPVSGTVNVTGHSPTGANHDTNPHPSHSGHATTLARRMWSTTISNDAVGGTYNTGTSDTVALANNTTQYYSATTAQWHLCINGYVFQASRTNNNLTIRGASRALVDTGFVGPATTPADMWTAGRVINAWNRDLDHSRLWRQGTTQNYAITWRNATPGAGWAEILPTAPTVIFDPNGATTYTGPVGAVVINNALVDLVEPPRPALAGHTFGGWYVMAGAAPAAADAAFTAWGIMPSSHLTIYAKWLPLQLTLSDPSVEAPVPFYVAPQAGVTLEVLCTAENGTVEYQWYSTNIYGSNDITGATMIAGADAQTFTVPTTTAGQLYYFCVVTATRLPEITVGEATITKNSNAVRILVMHDIGGTVEVSNPTGVLAAGDNPPRYGDLLTVNYNGLTPGAAYRGPVTYQWFRGTNPIPASEGGTAASYSVKAADLPGGIGETLRVEVSTNWTIGEVSSTGIAAARAFRDPTDTPTIGIPYYRISGNDIEITLIAGAEYAIGDEEVPTDPSDLFWDDIRTFPKDEYVPLWIHFRWAATDTHLAGNFVTASRAVITDLPPLEGDLTITAVNTFGSIVKLDEVENLEDCLEGNPIEESDLVFMWQHLVGSDWVNITESGAYVTGKEYTITKNVGTQIRLAATAPLRAVSDSIYSLPITVAVGVVTGTVTFDEVYDGTEQEPMYAVTVGDGLVPVPGKWSDVTDVDEASTFTPDVSIEDNVDVSGLEGNLKKAVPQLGANATITTVLPFPATVGYGTTINVGVGPLAPRTGLGVPTLWFTQTLPTAGARTDTAPTAMGTYLVEVTFDDTGDNFEEVLIAGAVELGLLTIGAADLNKDSFLFTAPSVTFNAAAQLADVTWQAATGNTGSTGITIVYKQGGEVVQPINAGVYDLFVNVAATGNFGAIDDLDLEETFEILPLDATSAEVGSFGALTFNGAAQTVTGGLVTVGTVPVAGTWSQVTNVGQIPTFTPVVATNFTNLNVTQTSFTAMTPYAINTGNVEIGAFGLTYTGSAQIPAATVTAASISTAVPGLWSAVTEVGDPSTFTPTPGGNFSGLLEDVDPEMDPLDISTAVINTLVFDPFTFNNAVQTPEADVIITAGSVTVDGEWSEVTNVGQMSTFTPDDDVNFSGTLEANPGMLPFGITPTNTTVVIPAGLTYTGNPQNISGPTGMTVTSNTFSDIPVTGVWSPLYVTDVKDPLSFTASGNFSGVLTDVAHMAPADVPAALMTRTLPIRYDDDDDKEYDLGALLAPYLYDYELDDEVTLTLDFDDPDDILEKVDLDDETGIVTIALVSTLIDDDVADAEIRVDVVGLKNHADFTFVITVTVTDKTVLTVDLETITATPRDFNDSDVVALVGGSAAFVGASQPAGVTIVVPATGTMLDKNVGTGKPVSFTVTLSGANADNFMLSQDDISVPVDIAPYALSINGATVTEKEYDGYPDAEVTAVTFTSTETWVPTIELDEDAPLYWNTFRAAGEFAAENAGVEIDVAVTVTLRGQTNFSIANNGFTVVDAGTITPTDNFTVDSTDSMDLPHDDADISDLPDDWKGVGVMTSADPDGEEVDGVIDWFANAARTSPLTETLFDAAIAAADIASLPFIKTRGEFVMRPHAPIL
jgi:hypothetical protein